jgi:hypothetical protein
MPAASRLARKLIVLSLVIAICLVVRPAPSGLTDPTIASVQAAALRPAPVDSQEAAAGSALLKLAGDSLGAGTVTFAETAALGWLFSAFGVNMSPDDSAQVLAELQQISAQITALQGQVAAGDQAVSCNVGASTYADLVQNNPAIPNIYTINTKLGNIAHATSRAEMLTYVSGEGGVNQIFAQDPGMIQEIYDLIFGTTGADGALQLYSNELTTCHDYFNQTDSTKYSQVWNDLAGLLTAACTIDVNYYRYNASGASSNADRSGYLTTADVDATACHGYAQAMLDLQPNVIANANEVIACPSSSPGGPCNSSDGTAWLWAGEEGPADCNILSYSADPGADLNYPVCATLFDFNQGDWVLPTISNINTFFSSCASSSEASACLISEGLGLTGDFQAVGVNPDQNLQFWTYDPSIGTPGQEPSWWAGIGGNEPYPAGWCEGFAGAAACSLIAVNGSSNGIPCACFGAVILQSTAAPLSCYWWCASAADAAMAEIGQGQSAAAGVRANPPSIPAQAATTARPAETSSPSPMETSRPVATATSSPTPTARPTETPSATPRATETPRPTETATPRPAETAMARALTTPER